SPLVAHLGPAIERSFAAVARLYCERAGIQIPDLVDRLLRVVTPQPSSPRVLAA
ncbi:unnamed protein product, partial [marine sediment metagenome]